MIAKIKIFLFAYFLYASELAYTQTVLKGLKNYTGITLGNINILISAPHGGILSPSDIGNRTEGTLGDTNTLQLATELRDQLARLFMSKNADHYLPFLVYNNLYR